VRVILRSTDLSFIESARVALEANDIATLRSDEHVTGLPSSPVTLSLVEDEDFDRAVALVGGLQRTSPKPWWEDSWAPWAILIVAVMLVVALSATLFW
jgi:hypothetical protein